MGKELNQSATVELSRPWARDPGGRTGAIKAEKVDPKQIPCIQSKIDAIIRPIAQQIIADFNDRKV